MSTPRPHMGSWLAIPFVAARDLLNEKLITISLIVSVIAVLAPIMLLTSVKVGFIDRLRSDFIGDPSFREIRPAEAALRQESFFTEIRTWPGVIYAVPSVMLVPREVDLVVEQDGKRVRSLATLIPTDSSDPLFEKLTGEPPAGDAVVITEDVAAALGVGLGDSFDLNVTRLEDDQRRRVALTVTVAGLLPDESLPQPAILAERAVDLAVENYRAGIAVPNRGWSGIASIPKQTFERVLVATPEPLGETALTNLRIRIGASSTETTTLAAARELFGLDPAVTTPNDARHIYVLVKAGAYSDTDLREAADVLSNIRAEVIGYNPPLAGALLGETVSLVAIDPALAPDMAALATRWTFGPARSFIDNAGIYLPEGLRTAWETAGQPSQLELLVPGLEQWATQDLTLRTRMLGFSGIDAVAVSPSLLGMLYRGAATLLVFDPAAVNFAEQSSGFRGFRVIADDINTVPPLVERFVAEGVAVRAKSDDILKLQRLERSLDILVLVVASVAIAGGYAILSASFFANVQRKRVDYATIRLIGMRKTSVFQIPIMQAVLIATLGFLGSCALFFGVSSLLNSVIAVELGFDGQLSKLYPEHFLFVGLFVIAGSCVASLAASREATRIDPAQALRAG